MCIRWVASDLDSIEIISTVFANDSVILARTVAQSVLVSIVFLPCNTSLKTRRSGEANDEVR